MPTLDSLCHRKYVVLMLHLCYGKMLQKVSEEDYIVHIDGPCGLWW